MPGYSYRYLDDFLLNEQQTWEERAETLASRLNSMSDNDPHRDAVTQLWQDQERIIDVISMLRRRFAEVDRQHRMDASHDTQKRRHLP